MKKIAAPAAIALSAALLLAGCGNGRSATDISSAASTLASEDSNDSASDSYAQALTTLNGRCAEKPQDIAVAASLTKDAWQAAGKPVTDLAVLQQMVKVSAAAADKNHENCKAIAQALTAGVQGG